MPSSVLVDYQFNINALSDAHILAIQGVSNFVLSGIVKFRKERSIIIVQNYL